MSSWTARPVRKRDFPFMGPMLNYSNDYSMTSYTPPIVSTPSTPPQINSNQTVKLFDLPSTKPRYNPVPITIENIGSQVDKLLKTNQKGGNSNTNNKNTELNQNKFSVNSVISNLANTPNVMNKKFISSTNTNDIKPVLKRKIAQPINSIPEFTTKLEEAPKPVEVPKSEEVSKSVEAPKSEEVPNINDDHKSFEVNKPENNISEDKIFEDKSLKSINNIQSTENIKTTEIIETVKSTNIETDPNNSLMKYIAETEEFMIIKKSIKILEEENVKLNIQNSLINKTISDYTKTVDGFSNQLESLTKGNFVETLTESFKKIIDNKLQDQFAVYFKRLDELTSRLNKCHPQLLGSNTLSEEKHDVNELNKSQVQEIITSNCDENLESNEPVVHKEIINETTNKEEIIENNNKLEDIQQPINNEISTLQADSTVNYQVEFPLIDSEYIQEKINNLPDDLLDLYESIIEQKSSNVPRSITLPNLKKASKMPYRGYNIQPQGSGAFELHHQGISVVFVILRHISNVSDNKLWIASYNSIRKLYRNKIIIIDDNSTAVVYDTDLINTEIVRSEFPGAGEILPYYYFLKYKWASKMVFLHDSMFIHKSIEIFLNSKFKLFWYFEPNGHDDNNKILLYLTLLKNNFELISYFLSKKEWLGCFGCTSICDLELIQYLDNKYEIFKTLPLAMKKRCDRETFERVLGIILFYEKIITKENCSINGDIIKYPKAFEFDGNFSTESCVSSLNKHQYNTPIVKVWRGR